MKTATISNKIHLLFFLLVLLASLNTSAQSKIAPVKYSLNTASDFRQYEKDVLICINWLADHPRTYRMEERRKVEDFLVKWIYGSPYVNVIIDPYIMKLSSKNANLLLSFMFGYTLYQLDHLGDKNLIPANIAGINQLLIDYQLNQNTLQKDGLIEKVIQLKEEGKLTDWLEPQLSQKSY